jgi:hypothetical protein
MQSIKARMIKTTMWFELPIDISSGISYSLENYLKEKGYRFNAEKGYLECVYEDEEENTHMLAWHMKSTLRKSIIHTHIFQGEIFPFEQDIRKIIRPVLPQRYYILEGDGCDADNVIRVLFKKKFEIIDLTKNGNLQVFKRKNNEVKLLYKVNNKFKLSFNGFENMSRSILAAFAIA